MVGRAFGRYKIVEELGRGAMGVVYRASDPVIGRTVAVKVVNATFLEQVGVPAEEYYKRFQREAEVAGRLSHPNIVKIFDRGHDFLVMEFVEGQSLAALIRGRVHLPLSRMLEIVGQIGEALDYAHGQGVIHRDVKPANVMIQPDGMVKVMDFGLARVESSTLTAAGEILGSASYMAPEVVVGGSAGTRSDIFGLGVVAYELMTGGRPFGGGSVSAIIQRIVKESPGSAHALNLNVPPAYDPIFSKVLAKDPAARYATAGEFVDDLVLRKWEDRPALAVAFATEKTTILSKTDLFGGDSAETLVRMSPEEGKPEAPGPAEATILTAHPGEIGAPDLEKTIVPMSAPPAPKAGPPPSPAPPREEKAPPPLAAPPVARTASAGPPEGEATTLPPLRAPEKKTPPPSAPEERTIPVPPPPLPTSAVPASETPTPKPSPPPPELGADTIPPVPPRGRKTPSLGLVLGLGGLLFLVLVAGSVYGVYAYLRHRAPAPTPAPTPTTTLVAAPSPEPPEPSPTLVEETPIPSPEMQEAAPEPAKPKPSPRVLASLLVDSRPQGARVLLGGAQKGVTPFRTTLPLGTISLSVEKEGFKAWGKTLSLSPGQQTVRADLEPLPPPASPSPVVRAGDLVPLTPDVVLPKKVSGDTPSAPSGVKKKGTLSVVLEFIVMDDGSVGDVKIVESGGDALDKAAVAAVSRWRYTPATLHGIQVRVQQRAKFTFEFR